MNENDAARQWIEAAIELARAIPYSDFKAAYALGLMHAFERAQFITSQQKRLLYRQLVQAQRTSLEQSRIEKGESDCACADDEGGSGNARTIPTR